MLAPSSEKLEGRLVFNSIEAGRHHGRCRLEEGLELIVRKLGLDQERTGAGKEKVEQIRHIREGVNSLKMSR